MESSFEIVYKIVLNLNKDFVLTFTIIINPNNVDAV